MILGIGNDLVQVARMATAYARYGERLTRRILSAAEADDLARAASKPHFLAKRFAAKEALAKAVGTGLRPPVLMPAMTVGHDALGKPAFVFDVALSAWLSERGMQRVHLSLSDEHDLALAFVVIESTGVA
jgi:holo-[acyl-carrier protein] synthase